MSVSPSHRAASAALAALALLTQVPGAAQAFSYSGAYITTWSGCDSDCSGASALTYTDDQINDFDSRMASYGHTRKRKLANASVWASDYVEDGLGGQDHLYTDDSDVVAYSGHGSAPTVSSSQIFQAPMCRAGSASSCRYDSRNSRFGERSGGFATPNPGNTRWMLWFTCYSVHTSPNQQWDQAMYRGLEYVMGYRGLSADSSTTTEVPGDWVGEAIGGSSSFKSAWFWAIEDWWVDDTGAVVAAGNTEADAINRRENLTRNWARRAGDHYGTYYAWSWHEG